jgi:hypothetical protein
VLGACCHRGGGDGAVSTRSTLRTRARSCGCRVLVPSHPPGRLAPGIVAMLNRLFHLRSSPRAGAREAGTGGVAVGSSSAGSARTPVLRWAGVVVVNGKSLLVTKNETNKKKTYLWPKRRRRRLLGPFLCSSSYGGVSVACALHFCPVLVIPLVVRRRCPSPSASLSSSCGVVRRRLVVVIVIVFLVVSSSPPHCFSSLRPPCLRHASCSFPPHEQVLVAVA